MFRVVTPFAIIQTAHFENARIEISLHIKQNLVNGKHFVHIDSIEWGSILRIDAYFMQPIDVLSSEVNLKSTIKWIDMANSK